MSLVMVMQSIVLVVVVAIDVADRNGGYSGLW